ncbi:MAG: hypothetical protein ACREPV_01130 [Lysobacter sp.]
MTPDEIRELQNLTVAEIEDRVGELDADALAELRKLETEDGKAEGRKGVLAAIDAAEAAGKLTGIDPPAEKATAGKLPKAEALKPAGTPRPAWQAADYNGPLDIAQANWRRENVKPVRKASTK